MIENVLKCMNVLHRFTHGLVAIDLFEQEDKKGFLYYINDFTSLTTDELKPYFTDEQIEEIKYAQMTLLNYENESIIFISKSKRVLMHYWGLLYSKLRIRLEVKR